MAAIGFAHQEATLCNLTSTTETTTMNIHETAMELKNYLITLNSLVNNVPDDRLALVLDTCHKSRQTLGY
jgi:hypothetical protein